MKIAERTATWRRERRVLLWVSRAAWRLDQAERERNWALASARAEGVSIRALAAAVRLSSSRVHQIVVAADLDELDAALGDGPAEPVELPHDQGVASTQVVERRGEAGPVGDGLAGADLLLVDAAAPGAFEGVALKLGVLAVGGDAGEADEVPLAAGQIGDGVGGCGVSCL